MRRSWTILATLIAALAVSMGSAGLRAVHVATSPEHASHHEALAHAERAAAPCGHSHTHSCESEPETPADHGHSHDSHGHSHDSHGHDADCATCELLTTLTSDIAMPELAAAPTGAAGEVTGVACALPTTRTLASVRARPPPAA